MGHSDILNNRLYLLGKLSASLIHEIRNPLFVLKLNIDFLSSLDSTVSPEALESIKACSEATERMMFLIQNFSDFSKKNNSATQEICSINDVTQIAVNIMQSLACKNNVYIKTKLQSDLPSIYFQKDKLLQVFLNLITNAIEAENTNDTIWVRTYSDKTDNNTIYWEVEDSGIGIKKEDVNTIFEDFYTGKKNGTGLGLGVCTKLLNEYGAELDFESTYKKGSKFFIKFNTNKK